MAIGDIQMTVVGNLTADPELKFTPAGAAMARFTVASTPRTFDRESGQYKDGTATFLRCTAWRQLAEHIAESLAKGQQVIVQGRLRQHNWQTETGENRSMLQLDIDEIGPSLRFATATITRASSRQTPAASDSSGWGSVPAAPGGDAPPF